MSGVASGVTGAAPIWNGIMTQLLAGKGPEPFQRPAGVIQNRFAQILVLFQIRTIPAIPDLNIL